MKQPHYLGLLTTCVCFWFYMSVVGCCALQSNVGPSTALSLNIQYLESSVMDAFLPSKC